MEVLFIVCSSSGGGGHVDTIHPRVLYLPVYFSFEYFVYRYITVIVRRCTILIRFLLHVVSPKHFLAIWLGN